MSQVANPLNQLEATEQSILFGALELFKRGEYGLAEPIFGQLLARNPRNYIALYALSVIESIQGQVDKALERVNASIDIKPDFAKSYLVRSILHRNQRSFYEALKDAQTASELDPSLVESELQIQSLKDEITKLSAESMVALQPTPEERTQIVDVMAQADQFTKLGQAELAIKAYQDFLSIPGVEHGYIAMFNLAVLLNQAQRVEEAVNLLKASIQIKSDFFMAYLSWGTIIEQLGKSDEAIGIWSLCLDNPLIDHPINTDTKIKILNNIGRVQENLRRYNESEATLFKSLVADPNQGPVLHHWIHLRQKQCEWPVIYGTQHTEEEVLNSASPLSMLGLSADPKEQLDCARKFVKEKVGQFERMVPFKHRYGHQKLKIGYLSSNLSMHAVSLLTVELFETHNRDNVEIHAFCWSPEDGTPFRERVRSAFDHFHTVAGLSDEAAAELIKSLEIDVVVDLQGLTSGARPDLIARGAAPVQVAYLGYPGSSAMPYVDYVVADHFIMPLELLPHFTEKPLYMPTVFQVSDSKRPIATTPSREVFGLPEDKLIFCAFNNNYKFTPEVFESWMRILRACPDSVLWLLEDNVWSKTNLTNAAMAHGIHPDRLRFAGRINPSDYLARFRAADLFLDTTPYNAGTTANDALWAGLPILTLSGQTYVSRMAGSLLNSIGLNGLITFTHDEYERRAIELYNKPQLLAQYKNQLAAAKSNKKLFNTEVFCREFETALKSLFE